MTHIVYTSIAARLDAGTYSPALARALRSPVAVPSRPVAGPFAGMAAVALPYVGCALLGALLALAYGVTP
jgi:hypothetical protein